MSRGRGRARRRRLAGKEHAIAKDRYLRPKADLLRDLGYGGELGPVDEALEAAGISNPWRPHLQVSKTDAVRRLLAELFLLVCARSDCREAADAVGDGRVVAPATDPQHCAFCGGSANERAVLEMLEACRTRGWRRLCVVGGSPHTRTALEGLVGDALELRLVDGTISRSRGQADADLRWADVVVVWGSTQLGHAVSLLYKGPNVVQMARRSVQEVARSVTRSARGER